MHTSSEFILQIVYYYFKYFHLIFQMERESMTDATFALSLISRQYFHFMYMIAYSGPGHSSYICI